MDEPLHVQVARALNWTNLHPAPPNGSWWGTEPYGGQNMQVPVYDRSWCSMGPIIDRLKIELSYSHKHKLWFAEIDYIDAYCDADTALQAVAGLIVKLKEKGKLPND